MPFDPLLDGGSKRRTEDRKGWELGMKGGVAGQIPFQKKPWGGKYAQKGGGGGGAFRPERRTSKRPGSLPYP